MANTIPPTLITPTVRPTPPERHYFDTSKNGLGALVPYQEVQEASPTSVQAGPGGTHPIVRTFHVEASTMVGAGRSQTGQVVDLDLDSLKVAILGKAWYTRDTSGAMYSARMIERLLPMIDPDSSQRAYGTAADLNVCRVATEIVSLKGSGGDGLNVYDLSTNALWRGQRFDRYQIGVKFEFVRYSLATDAVALAQGDPAWMAFPPFSIVTSTYSEKWRFTEKEWRPSVEYFREPQGTFIWTAEGANVFRGQPSFSPAAGNTQVNDGLGRPVGVGDLTMRWLQVPIDAPPYWYYDWAVGGVNRSAVYLPGLLPGSFEKESLLFLGATYQLDRYADGDRCVNVNMTFRRRPNWNRFPHPADGTLRYVGRSSIPAYTAPPPLSYPDPNPDGKFLPSYDFGRFFLGAEPGELAIS